MEHQHGLLGISLVLLGLSLLVICLLKKIKLTPILGYLLVGVLVGPYALDWLPENKNLEYLAEIGVVFLLFMIGLEFSFSKLMTMRHVVFGLGGLQVFISSLSGGLIAWMMGLTWQGALIAGGALALSSTAIVAKQISDQFEIQENHGQLSIPILLFQDLAVVPLLAVIPILAETGEQSLALPLLTSLVQGIFAVFIIFYVGRWLLRPFYHLIAATQSAEVFTLATLCVCLLAAWFTAHLGLSLALGAFLVGLMLSETEYRHQLQVEIRPFRDILLGLFFIVIGACLNIELIIEQWFWVGLLTLGLIIGKGAVIAVLVGLSGYDRMTAFRTGLVLGQAGEFGFAILFTAISFQIVTLEAMQPIIAASVLSMLFSSIFIRYNRQIGEYIFRVLRFDLTGHSRDTSELDHAQSLSEHVVICGFNRIGRHLVNLLENMNVRYVALDIDHNIVRRNWELGKNVVYGDASKLDILKKVGLKNASAVVVTFNYVPVVDQIIQHSRSINQNIPTIVRYSDQLQSTHQDCKHVSLIPEYLEIGTMLAIHLLENLGVTREQAIALIEGATHN